MQCANIKNTFKIPCIHVERKCSDRVHRENKVSARNKSEPRTWNTGAGSQHDSTTQTPRESDSPTRTPWCLHAEPAGGTDRTDTSCQQNTVKIAHLWSDTIKIVLRQLACFSGIILKYISSLCLNWPQVDPTTLRPDRSSSGTHGGGDGSKHSLQAPGESQSEDGRQEKNSSSDSTAEFDEVELNEEENQSNRLFLVKVVKVPVGNSVCCCCIDNSLCNSRCRGSEAWQSWTSNFSLVYSLRRSEGSANQHCGRETEREREREMNSWSLRLHLKLSHFSFCSEVFTRSTILSLTPESRSCWWLISLVRILHLYQQTEQIGLLQPSPTTHPQPELTVSQVCSNLIYVAGAEGGTWTVEHRLLHRGRSRLSVRV